MNPGLGGLEVHTTSWNRIYMVWKCHDSATHPTNINHLPLFPKFCPRHRIYTMKIKAKSWAGRMAENSSPSSLAFWVLPLEPQQKRTPTPESCPWLTHTGRHMGYWTHIHTIITTNTIIIINKWLENVKSPFLMKVT